MTYSGRVKGGVVVFEGTERPAEGSEVRVEVLGKTQATPPIHERTVGEGLARLAGAAKGLPADLAEGHDSYRRAALATTGS